MSYEFAVVADCTERDVTSNFVSSQGSPMVRSARIRSALEYAYAAGVEAGKAEAAARVSAWEPIVKAAREWEVALPGSQREFTSYRAKDASEASLIAAVRALAPEHRPGPGGGA